MPAQNIRTYLRLQRQQEPGRRRWDSEAEVALACLPKETCVFQYESMSQMEDAAHSVDVDEGGFCVFVNVPESIVGRDREAVRIGRISYYPESKILISKMPGRPHEVAAESLNDALHDSVARMGMDWFTNLISLGSTAVEHKEPDISLQPANLPPGRSPQWPSLVVETGYSKSQPSLDNNARRWLGRSNGDVRVLITIRVSRTRLIVKRWARTGRTRASILQTIAITKRGQQPIDVTGGPLRIPFWDVFLRAPVANQGDFVYGRSFLEQWARRVWSQF